MFLSKILKRNLLLIILAFVSCSSGKSPALKADGYVISSEEDAASERWAEYLFRHLKKRAKDPSTVVLVKGTQQGPENFKKIHIEVAADLKHSYCIKHDEKRLHIRTKDEATALWMAYQVIESISNEDSKISTPDLPPPVIALNSSCFTFDFSYRGPHYSPNLEEDMAPVYGNDMVETAWGLWGHQLSKIAAKLPSKNVYALVNNKRNSNQLCFSSQELYDGVRNFIIDEYGKGEKNSHRFMLMPNDNTLVCTCPLCLQAGNTNKNATPAVAEFMRKLADEFPRHQFFMTAYLTTHTAPEYELSENSGVFFSTIELKKGVALNMDQKETKKFIQDLRQWRIATPNLYIWDYGANFDDYLTPSPLLYGLQKQLIFFKENQIRGIFLNGSGYDYMPFDDIKTYVSGALMMNTDADIDALTRNFFKKKYPVSGTLLANYYLGLEAEYDSKNKPYNLYGGMRENLKTYFNPETFTEFYTQLQFIIPKTSGEERVKLEKLFTALTYPRMQIAYTQGHRQWGYATLNGKKLIPKPEVRTWLAALKNYENYENLNSYKETEGNLAEYIGEWKELLAGDSYENQLLEGAVSVLSEKDEGFEKTQLLNDGTPGFTEDYHQGWYLNSSKNFRVAFSTETLKQGGKIRIRFLRNERHRILPPKKITVIADGNTVRTLTKNDFTVSENTAMVEMAFPLLQFKNIELHFDQDPDTKSIIACDEIQVLN